MNDMDMLREALATEAMTSEHLARALLFFLCKKGIVDYQEFLTYLDEKTAVRMEKMILKIKEAEEENERSMQEPPFYK